MFTKTLAEIYVAQGHLAEARDIYRKMLEAAPEDADLLGRLAVVDAQLNQMSAGPSDPRIGRLTTALRRLQTRRRDR
ncbi:MAG: cytochrome c-type biogenesis protein CcmH/NrfG [Myxococcota bacterium]|jgi:cytochrome c-type biogenesis protein CcmH/NrfG